ATAEVKLPESLTTYRIMAVGADKASRFGSGESEIRINKPVVLKAAFPRFMTRGDKAYFGSVVTSQLTQPGSAIVTMRSLDPGVLQVSGDARRVIQIGAGASAEVRFDVVATGVCRARVPETVKLGGEEDALGKHTGRGDGVARKRRGVRRGRARCPSAVRDAEGHRARCRRTSCRGVVDSARRPPRRRALRRR